MGALPLILRASLAAGLVVVLAGCDPQAAADSATRGMARQVVLPVVTRELPGPVAEAATACILDAAAPEEIRAIARDYGVEAGTQTRANIRILAERPAARDCFTRAGVPPLR